MMIERPQSPAEPLLVVRALRVRFGPVTVLEDIGFELRAGETLGLVGESGSGKSTLARALLRLIAVQGGEIRWNGGDLLQQRGAALRRLRRDLQIVFQDPMASLNPRLRVGDLLTEPLRLFEPDSSGGERATRVARMLERVGLSPDAMRRYPHEFSGGQCQRIAIARAMMLQPKLLICDEPVSSLDVSIQGQVVNLLMDLQQELGTAMLFISHNLAVVRHVSHRVLVIYRGRLVEVAGRNALFALPAHPYTRALLAAVPDPTRQFVGEALTTGDEPPPAADRVPGCAFHDRCPHARNVCRETVPKLEEVETGHIVACHRWREVVYS